MAADRETMTLGDISVPIDALRPDDYEWARVLQGRKMDTESRCAAPEIEARWVFISTNREIQLAAGVASYFPDTNKYLCFFEFPAVEYPYTGSSDFGTDGYISRINGDRAAINIGNALAKIQPERIVLLRLTEIEKGYLAAHLPTEITIELNSPAELKDRLAIAPQFAGEVRCKPDEAIRGLLKARFERNRLVFDDLADPFERQHPVLLFIGRLNDQLIGRPLHKNRLLRQDETQSIVSGYRKVQEGPARRSRL